MDSKYSIQSILVLLCFCTGAVFSHAQESEAYYNSIHTTLASGDIQKALIQYDTLADMAQEEGDLLHLSLAYSSKAEILFLLRKHNESLETYKKAAAVTKQLQKPGLLSGDYLRIGSNYRELGEPDSALHYYRLAQATCEPNDSLKLRNAYNQIGSFYEGLGQGDSAIYYHLKSYDYADPSDSFITAGIFVNIGNIFLNRYNYDEAINYYGRAIELIKKNKVPNSYCTVSLNKAEALLQRDKLEEAEKVINEVENIIRRDLGNRMLVRCLTLKAQLYVRQNKSERLPEIFKEIDPIALDTTEHAMPKYYLTRLDYAIRNEDYDTYRKLQSVTSSLIDEQPHVINKITWAGLQARYYANQNDWKRSNAFLTKRQELSDSFYKTSQQKIVNDLEVRFETKLQRKQYELLEAKNNLTQQKLANTRLIVTILGLGALLTSILLYRLFRLNGKLKNALKQKDTLIKEVHHRVKNNLQFISSLLSLQSDSISNPKTAHILREGQDRVQSMSLIHQRLYQKENVTDIDMKDYFSRLIQSLFDSYNINQDKITLNLDIDPITLDVDRAIPLGLIANELISNSLKYAFQDDNGEIDVSLKSRNKELLFSIHDDGCGVNESEMKQSKSFGYQLIQALKQQLNGEIAISGTSGTKIDLYIPFT